MPDWIKQESGLFFPQENGNTYPLEGTGTSSPAPSFRATSQRQGDFATYTSRVCAAPTGTVQNDVVVGFVQTFGNASVVVTPPTGWTKLGQVVDVDSIVCAAWIRRGASAFATTWTSNVAVEWEIACAGYSGCVTTGSPVNDYQTALINSNGQAFPTVNTTLNNTMLVGAAAFYTWAAGASANWDNERLDTGGNSGIKLYDKVLATAGPSPTLSVTGSGDGVHVIVALIPA